MSLSFLLLKAFYLYVIYAWIVLPEINVFDISFNYTAHMLYNDTSFVEMSRLHTRIVLICIVCQGKLNCRRVPSSWA